MIVQDFWEIKHMRKEWIPGPFFLGGTGLGTRIYGSLLAVVVHKEWLVLYFLNPV